MNNSNEIMRKTKRKFPGPAGLLNEDDNDRTNTTICASQILSQESPLFESQCWLEACENYKDLINTYNITWIKESSKLFHQKAPFLAAIVIEMKETNLNLFTLTLRDKYGHIEALIQKDFCKKNKNDIDIGSVLLIRQLSVLTTKLKKFFITISEKSLLAIYRNVKFEELAENSNRNVKIVNVNDFNKNELEVSIKNAYNKRMKIDVQQNRNFELLDEVLNEMESEKVTNTNNVNANNDNILTDADIALLFDDDDDF